MILTYFDDLALSKKHLEVLIKFIEPMLLNEKVNVLFIFVYFIE